VPQATRLTLALLLRLALVAPLLPAEPAGARPERIRPGQSYYSDDFVVDGLVHDLAAEKNFEEVYQLYRYFEAIYDAAERVELFREYERGEPVRTEQYRYGPDGALVERTLRRPGEADAVTRPAPAAK
jgi:hypothetical protein